MTRYQVDGVPLTDEEVHRHRGAVNAVINALSQGDDARRESTVESAECCRESIIEEAYRVANSGVREHRAQCDEFVSPSPYGGYALDGIELSASEASLHRGYVDDALRGQLAVWADPDWGGPGSDHYDEVAERSLLYADAQLRAFRRRTDGFLVGPYYLPDNWDPLFAWIEEHGGNEKAAKKLLERLMDVSPADPRDTFTGNEIASLGGSFHAVHTLVKAGMLTTTKPEATDAS